ncbi:hypothetical protein QQ045_011079 [Rhodiola kirilowii]
MPTSNYFEPSSTPFFDARSLQSAQHQREDIEFARESRIYYSGGLKTEVQSRCAYESYPRKAHGRPIEKFQSEVLPPRSAKSIPITQHTLLSPIKTSGMFFTGDAAQIMEAAAKIIETGSQAIGKNKMPLVGSPSLPIKVKDLKEKMRATHERPKVGHSFASFRKSDKERIDPVQQKTVSGYSSTSFKMNDKERFDAFQEKNSVGYSSVYLEMEDKDGDGAIQQKTRAGYASSSFRLRDKERVDAANVRLEFGCSSGSFKARDKEMPVAPPKSSKPAPTSETPVESGAAKYLKGQTINKSWNGSRDAFPFRMALGVLRQNNQRQNYATGNGVPSKPLIANSQGKKAVIGNSSSTRHKNSMRESSKTRKMYIDAKNSEVKNVPRKKRNIDGGLMFEENQTSDIELNKSLKPEADMDRYAWIEDSRKKRHKCCFVYIYFSNDMGYVWI